MLVDWTEDDRRFMRTALELARRGEGCVEPNPMVGAVIVRDGRVVGQGYHHQFGGPHAEVFALAEAGDQARGATLYVTLEPCAHYGKTPPCAPQVVRADLARVVCATADPMAHAGGRGIGMLREAGIRAEVGLCREEAAFLNAPFFKRCSTGKPLVIAKWAMSADGKIATRTGDSRWISSAASRKLVHEIRGKVDAIVIGRGTARRDDPLLTCRDAERRRAAARVVLCGSDLPDVSSRLVQTAREIPVLLAYPQDAPADGLQELIESGCEAMPLAALADAPHRVDPEALLAALGERGATSVLVEGGSEVLGSFLDCGAIDRAMVFVCPLMIGGAQAVTAVGGKGIESIQEACALRHVEVRQVGPDVLFRAWLSDPLQWVPQPPSS